MDVIVDDDCVPVELPLLTNTTDIRRSPLADDRVWQGLAHLSLAYLSIENTIAVVVVSFCHRVGTH